MKILIILFAFLFSVKVNAEYVCSDNGLRVRSVPNVDGNILDVLPFGTEVFGDTVDGWMYLEEYGGYVCADYLQKTNPLDELECLGTWHITAYTWTGYECANGNYPTCGYTIAHNKLPFGTKVYIMGVGTRIVEDRGPESMGTNWCDLYMSYQNDCIQWGSQYRKVYLLK